MSPLSPISRKTILFFIFSFLISFFKIGDNGDKIKKKAHVSLISGLFSISVFQILRGHGDKPGDNEDKWQILELSDSTSYFLIILFLRFQEHGDSGDKWETLEGVPDSFHLFPGEQGGNVSESPYLQAF